MVDSAPPEPAAPDAARTATIASAHKALQQLDKASRAARTYGLHNAVPAKFLDLLHESLLAHFEAHGLLAVVVDRSTLSIGEDVVYRAEEDATEGLALRLYSDGIRELRLMPGVQPSDLRALVLALSSVDESAEGDDDVVTRLWAADVASISFVTAEDIIQAPSFSTELQPQQAGFFAAPPTSFSGILDKERRALATGPSAFGKEGAPAAGENLDRGQIGVVGFEVSAGEQEALRLELRAEAERVDVDYVLQMLHAILRSERSPELLSRALALMPPVLDDLLRGGDLQGVLGLAAVLEEAPQSNPAFDVTHRMLAGRVLGSLHLPERLSLLEVGLNSVQGVPAGLLALLARVPPEAVGTLFAALGNIRSPEQRAVIREFLVRLGVEASAPLLKLFGDPRPDLVLQLISIVVAWKEPGAADSLATLSRHPDPSVRREAISAIAQLRPRGAGASLVAFASDPDRGVRLHALRLLGTGHHEVPWEVFAPHVELESVALLPAVDKRTLFHALRACCGDAVVPLLAPLLVLDRGWTKRQKKEETALVAVDVLALHGTPAAAAALEEGQRAGSSAVQKACAAALEARARRSQPPQGS